MDGLDCQLEKDIPDQASDFAACNANLPRLSELTKKSRSPIIVTTGVGSHQMCDSDLPMDWRSFVGHFRGPRKAIGAKVAQPHAMGIDNNGDAFLSMSLHEMSVAADLGIKIKISVLNNEEQGVVRQWQALDYDNRYSQSPTKSRFR
ncbi:Thiamine pyrophosphate enzyme C-terminal TPP-binding [Penicillium subrubescens]|uniref:Thiamine pyrophosphate enzyme C-terminal TPP-binding n=1 Tax=Penicillium subrubescens TaxID=1316194 RepID=UPI002545920F|nr:Thiamine pyrophosphate enzyme C-terminal TPP-binding [Penicillium subrubescens]KAJ5900221.1 Thiamine pyrophosphate enzyme C-terminal TPP-binding [Penicillium subrubescens]